jgi:tetracycline resistance efflux pump
VNYGWLSLLPPLIAIILAIKTREVIFSLLFGIYVGWLIIEEGNLLLGASSTIDILLKVVGEKGNVEVIAFSFLIGSLITVIQRSGGMEGFVRLVQVKGVIKGRRSAGIFSFLIGIFVFIESNINALVIGTVSRPIFDRLKIPREKLAYICDATAAPVCILIPLNAWGAYIIAILYSQEVNDPFFHLLRSIPLNFYPIFALLILLSVILTGKDVGQMAEAEQRARTTGKLLRDGASPLISSEITALSPKEGVKPRALNMIVPVGVMVGMMPLSLYITGRGDIMKGSGSLSVLWSVAAALLVASLLYLTEGIFNLKELSSLILKGMGGMISLVAILVLAFGIGETCRSLGTGLFTASLVSKWLSGAFVPSLLFLTSCFISFSTGTSWGTFAILIPIGVPLVYAMGLDLPLALAAILGGGVFGDHASPISDTTLVSSMASACDHIDHVKTQLPYAFIAASAAFILYLILGFLFS